MRPNASKGDGRIGLKNFYEFSFSFTNLPISSLPVSLESDGLEAPSSFDAAFYDEDFDADLSDALKGVTFNDAAFLNKVAMSDAIKRAIPFRFGKRAPIPFRFGKRIKPFRFG